MSNDSSVKLSLRYYFAFMDKADFSTLSSLLQHSVSECFGDRKGLMYYFNDFKSAGEHNIPVTHFFIGNSIFYLSLELLTKFWQTSMEVALTTA